MENMVCACGRQGLPSGPLSCNLDLAAWMGTESCGLPRRATLMGGSEPKTAQPQENMNSARQGSAVQWMSHLPYLTKYIPLHGRD